MMRNSVGFDVRAAGMCEVFAKEGLTPRSVSNRDIFVSQAPVANALSRKRVTDARPTRLPAAIRLASLKKRHFRTNRSAAPR